MVLEGKLVMTQRLKMKQQVTKTLLMREAIGVSLVCTEDNMTTTVVMINVLLRSTDQYVRN